MAAEGNKTLIGAFIVGAMVLTVVGIMLFGSGTFFKESYRSVLFFKGSVTGLDLGAPVSSKGLPSAPSRISASYLTRMICRFLTV